MVTPNQRSGNDTLDTRPSQLHTYDDETSVLNKNLTEKLARQIDVRLRRRSTTLDEIIVLTISLCMLSLDVHNN
ncbi:hypothetical protein OUZ56_004470 [Daphnia magna]|uniref:Uncharacterized protein n=1 Tax=Daphnia magna TaxID=35525 RepID=A0ABQ9YPW3_9CRUS|nr:hypothetical protein OUZ56_004470 [Daphnia magna]